MSDSPSAPPPPQPRSLQDTGLPPVMMRDILLKTMFRMTLQYVSDIAQLCCLPLPLAQDLVDTARSQKLIEATGTLHATATNEMGYQLTDAGKARALDALAQSEYYGAMPVPLAEYERQVARQSIRNRPLDRAALMRGMGHLVLPPDLIATLGPAVSSGRSVLMYGPPGNGKSSISNGIRDALDDTIFVPRAIAYAGQTITVFDPTVHTPVDIAPDDSQTLRRSASRHDSRYVPCKRPSVVTGGELTLDMLELAFNPVARTYTAPMQMKSAGGVFIVDDLGRQKEPPQNLINRWIVPLESQRDILTLQSGEKFTVPFDTLVIFSTNFHPNEIFDGAALRRIFFKIKVNGPSQEDFLRIFAAIARKKNLPLDEASLLYLVKVKYSQINNAYANYQPGFLIDQIIAFCDFEGIPYQMTPDLIDRAWDNMFVRDEIIAR